LEHFTQLHAQITELLAVPLPSQEGGSHVTQHQVTALETLGSEGLPMHQFATKLGLSSGSATSLADRLVRAGFAVREFEEHDRRIVRLAPTESGRTLLSEYKRRRDAVLSELSKRFGGDRLVPISDCAAELLTLLKLESALAKVVGDEGEPASS
jgi:DNA-binding MarR family transcriptional regulator